MSNYPAHDVTLSHESVFDALESAHRRQQRALDGMNQGMQKFREDYTKLLTPIMRDSFMASLGTVRTTEALVPDSTPCYRCGASVRNPLYHELFHFRPVCPSCYELANDSR
jgi:hypothetical protein